MFGMEKQKKGPFAFDLEIDVKKDPVKAHKLMKTVDDKVHEIKNTLRQGNVSKDFDNLGILLQGYVSLQKVLKKISTKK